MGQPFIAEWTTWKVAVTLNHGDAGSTPTPASISMPCGVTGNIPLFESVDSRFKPWRGNWEVNSRLGKSPVFLPFLTPVAQSEEAAVSKPVNVRVRLPPGVPNHAAVAQPEEVLVLETRGCGFDSHQQYQASGCNSVVRSLGLGPRSRGFKSYHPDHLPL